MNYDWFKIVGATAGIGGVAIASVVYIFREIIRKEIFPQLTKDQAYKLLNRIITLTFIIGLLGIAAYVYLNLRSEINSNSSKEQTPTPSPSTVPLIAPTTTPSAVPSNNINAVPTNIGPSNSSNHLQTNKFYPKIKSAQTESRRKVIKNKPASDLLFEELVKPQNREN